VLGGVVIAIALIALINRDSEPSYQGKSLSRWLTIDATSEHDSTPGEQTARAAMKHFSTNALPFLLTWVRYEPPRTGAKSILRALVRELPGGITPDALVDWCYVDPQEVRADRAAEAFALLDEQVRPAIPALAQLMNDRTFPNASSRALSALGYIGEEAIPVLLAQLANPNASYRQEVAYLFGISPKLATNPDAVVPLLVRCLADQDMRVRGVAAESLGRIAERSRTHAAMVVPALTNCLSATKQTILLHNATWALGIYGDQARAAVPALLNAITDPENRVRRQATNALQQIAPEVLTNAPPQ